MSILPNQSTDSIQPLSKFQGHFSQKRKYNPKMCTEPQKPWIAKAILSKKNKARDIMCPDFKLCYKAIVIKTHNDQ